MRLGIKNMTEPVLIANKLNKTYTSAAGVDQHVLKNLSLTVPQGEFVAIMGPSGSGKSTLLNVLSTLMKPTTGEVMINNKDMQEDKELSFDAIDTVKGCIVLFTGMIDTMTFNKDIMEASTTVSYTHLTLPTKRIV